jgi:hypothetical protein
VASPNTGPCPAARAASGKSASSDEKITIENRVIERRARARGQIFARENMFTSASG